MATKLNVAGNQDYEAVGAAMGHAGDQGRSCQNLSYPELEKDAAKFIRY